MGRSLRRTSLLLMVIWFANALTYYGLVLLTTTVSRLQHGTALIIDVLLATSGLVLLGSMATPRGSNIRCLYGRLVLSC